MLDSKKVLKIYGILFILFAILDIISVTVNWFYGDMNFINDVQLPDGAESIIKVITIVGLVVIAVGILIKLFLGIRGIQQSNGTYKGKAHIKLAKIILVLTIIMLLVSLPGMKWEISSLMDLFDEIVAIYIILDYIKYGKKVLDE